MAPEDVQVVAKPQRRSFTAKSRRRILREADACTTPGAIGASLGREGLFSSPLVEWRRARARGVLAALSLKQRAANRDRSIRAIAGSRSSSGSWPR